MVIADDVVVTKPTASPIPRVINWTQFDSSVILKTYRGKNSFICSAVLLSDTIGLTTAHCIEKSDRNEIILGMSLTDPTLKRVAVLQKSIRIHPKYEPARSLYDHDLAVFNLKEKVSLIKYPAIPDKVTSNLAKGAPLDRVGFGLRNKQNARTWTEVFFEKQEDQTLFLKDSLSVIGDSGSPIYQIKGDQIYLFAIHSTLLETGHVAAPALANEKNWIFGKGK